MDEVAIQKMKVLGLISSPDDPASRIRIMQYVPWFKKEKEDLYCKYFIPLRDADPSGWTKTLKKISGISEWRTTDFIKSIGRVPLLFGQSGYDIIWQNRLIQLHHVFWEKKLKKPVAFDIDDAIWLNEGGQAVYAKMAISAMIFAGNEWLAEFAAAHHKNVHVVPSTVDCDRLYPLPVKENNFTIGWIGTKSNFVYLEMIKAPLLNFLRKEKEAKFIIVSSEWPASFPHPDEQLIFQPWSAETENELINSFSVGIMPLADSEWARGKCSYKLLQYLACGKPVIASPVGNNRTIMSQSQTGIMANNEEEWFEAFNTLKNDAGLRNESGQTGRKLVEEKYSCAVWTPRIIRHMKSIQ
jgi:glycosyltransferase involved in cell wall biosynthesis